MLNEEVSMIIFIIEMLVMNIQVKREEERLRKDFGKDYEKYVNDINRFVPKIFNR